MICPFDFYEKGRHIYTFANICREDNGIELGDGTTKIFLCAGGTMDDISHRPRLKAFLDYISGTVTDDEYVQKLDKAVKIAKANKEWRREYMTLKMRDLENQEIGRKEGQQEAKVIDIRNIMDSLQCTLENAMDIIKIPRDQRAMYAGLVEESLR